jgi:hypothetical protein
MNLETYRTLSVARVSGALGYLKRKRFRAMLYLVNIVSLVKVVIIVTIVKGVLFANKNIELRHQERAVSEQWASSERALSER